MDEAAARRKLMRELYVAGATVDELGVLFGVSKSRAQQLLCDGERYDGAPSMRVLRAERRAKIASQRRMQKG